MSQHVNEWFEKAYKELTNDDLIEENRLKTRRKQSIEDRKKDSGIEY